MELKVYNTSAKEVKSISVNEAVFGQEYNESLIHQVVVAQLANKRQGTKSTLTRTEVRGGGKKPWRQKGTGRARQGSIRSPQWTGGGVVFAPKPRDFSQKINKRMAEQAAKSAFSAKIADENLVVVDNFAIAEAKTKLVAQILKNFEFKGKVLLIASREEIVNQELLRACANIANLTVATAELVSVYEVVANVKCIATEAAIKKLEEVYA